MLLTGDNEATARAVAAAVGIDDVISGALPSGKAQVIAELQTTGRSVVMVGDGVNDGPALSAAQLGMAVGSGTDVAICAADMILLRDDLSVVPDAIKRARATYRTIGRNLAWAFCYNMLALPRAAAGFLNPLVAAAAMPLSSVFVVRNNLRLRSFSVAAGRLHGGVVLGLHPLPDPAGRAGQLLQAGQHGLVVGPRPGEYLGVSRCHLDLGGLQVT
jgi:cation transport ATPase